MCPRLTFPDQQGKAASLLPPCWALPQELRDLGPLSTRAPRPLHVPMRVSPGLRCKMDPCFSIPVPWSLRGLPVE